MSASPPHPSGPRFLAQVKLACVPGIGSRMRQLLVERFGSPEAVFTAPVAEVAAIPRFGRRMAAAIAAAADDATAEEIISLCRSRDVDILPREDDAYPGLLARITDPPDLLFVRGRLKACDSLAVAIVGARHATAYGRRIAWQLAGGLARAGYTVVSGLARGIDAAAHRGAIDAGGRTIGVLGSGVLSIYPPEHAELALEVVAHGCLIGESPPLTPPLPGCFPQRNRIVSGLCLGTVVVEASDRSGALITARLAAEQGREVFAVPGPVDSRMSKGCHQLIRDGARLVQSIDDILEELGPLFETATSADGRRVASPAELQLDDLERQLLTAVDAAGGEAPVDIDELVASSGLAASQVLATLGVLEMRRLLRRLPGNRVARA
jgi:DNA processing protein